MMTLNLNPFFLWY